MSQGRPLSYTTPITDNNVYLGSLGRHIGSFLSSGANTAIGYNAGTMMDTMSRTEIRLRIIERIIANVQNFPHIKNIHDLDNMVNKLERIATAVYISEEASEGQPKENILTRTYFKE